MTVCIVSVKSSISLIIHGLEPPLTEDRSSSESKTPRQPLDGKRKHDELIAYEDAVDDEEQLHPLPTSDEAAFIAAPTASKRSYDELDADGFDAADNPVDNSSSFEMPDAISSC